MVKAVFLLPFMPKCVFENRKTAKRSKGPGLGLASFGIERCIFHCIAFKTQSDIRFGVAVIKSGHEISLVTNTSAIFLSAG